MSTNNATSSGYLDPHSSQVFGQILGLLLAVDGGDPVAGEWQRLKEWFDNGQGFGNPFLLNQEKDKWQKLATTNVAGSATDVNTALTDVGSWSGASADSFTKQYATPMAGILTDAQSNFSKMSEGFGAAFNSCLALYAGIISIVAGFGAIGVAGLITAESIQALATKVGTVLANAWADTAFGTARNDFITASTTYNRIPHDPATDGPSFPMPGFGPTAPASAPKPAHPAPTPTATATATGH